MPFVLGTKVCSENDVCPDDQTCIEGTCQPTVGLEEKVTKISEDAKSVAEDTKKAGEEAKIKVEEESKSVKDTMSDGFQKVKDLLNV